MDLALNNLQKLISHKTQPTNQPTIINISKSFMYNFYKKAKKIVLILFSFNEGMQFAM